MRETTKAHARRRAQWAFEYRWFVGEGLDVGSGDDPLRAADWPGVTAVTAYDLPDGSTEILPFADAAFDFVHASNVLEHMARPAAALLQWQRVVRPGGHVIFTVPDFTLYEGRTWPSRWNKGHRHWFDYGRLCELLGGLDVRKIELVDTRYNYNLRGVDQTWPADGAEAFWEVVIRV